MATITEKDVTKMGDRLAAIRETLVEARRMAFDLAKDGRKNLVFQLRGSYGGVPEMARDLDGFLACLRDQMHEASN